jgi:hypothetical protein
MPVVNIHSYGFSAGNNMLKLAKGVCLVLGFVDSEQAIPILCNMAVLPVNLHLLYNRYGMK